jgi:putative transposase
LSEQKKYKNKYRNDTTRLAYWDYGSNASYFITICTNNRVYYFGNIIKDTKFCVIAGQNVMQLTKLGKQAENCAIAIPDHFPFVRVDEFVVMPDHVHLLFTILKTDGNDGDTVGTQNIASRRCNRFGPQSKNVASIIRGYKIGVTRFARENNIDFKWQSRFYDHIVRNSDEYTRIKIYIKNNVNNWGKTK